MLQGYVTLIIYIYISFTAFDLLLVGFPGFICILNSNWLCVAKVAMLCVF